ncbi:MAG: CDP-alcohol phosphatidyltransferase family protein [Actinomycetia bacterium]|nr:CDP-alcohol phosphatidyltransferase family protein [Actinomycetes bacterium]
MIAGTHRKIDPERGQRKSLGADIFTWANLISLIRLLLLPVFWVLFVGYGNYPMAFLVIVIAALSDMLDGQVARATHTVSRLGQQLDPLVDRIFILIAVIAVFIVRHIPLWMLLLLVLRDALLLVLTVYQKLKFGRDFQVVFLGKLTTVLVMSGFCSLVLFWPVLPGAQLLDTPALPGLGTDPQPLGFWLIYVGILFSWITAAVYVVKCTRRNLSAEEYPEPSDA